MAGLDVGRQAPGRAHPAQRPGREAGDHQGPVEGERPGRLGERLVVADEHSHPAEGSVEGAQGVAGREVADLGRGQVDLAMEAQHAVAGDADGAVVGPVRGALDEPGADDRRSGDPGQAADLRPVGIQGARQLRLAGPPGAEISAQRALGQYHHPRAAPARVAHQRRDAVEAVVQVATEGGRNRTERRRRHRPPPFVAIRSRRQYPAGGGPSLRPERQSGPLGCSPEGEAPRPRGRPISRGRSRGPATGRGPAGACAGSRRRRSRPGSGSRSRRSPARCWGGGPSRRCPPAPCRTRWRW